MQNIFVLGFLVYLPLCALLLQLLLFFLHACLSWMPTQSCYIIDLQHAGYRSHHLPEKTALFLTVQMAYRYWSLPMEQQCSLCKVTERKCFGIKIEDKPKHRVGPSKLQEGQLSSITPTSISKSYSTPRKQLSPGLHALYNCSQSARLDATRLQSYHACHFLGNLATFSKVYFQPWALGVH